MTEEHTNQNETTESSSKDSSSADYLIELGKDKAQIIYCISTPFNPKEKNNDTFVLKLEKSLKSLASLKQEVMRSIVFNAGTSSENHASTKKQNRLLNLRQVRLSF